jgi:hypothetical protein
MENMLVLPFGRRDFIEQDPNIIFRHGRGGILVEYKRDGD